MMKASVDREHCRTQPSKHSHQAFFSPKISAYAVEAVKYFKNTAWSINKGIAEVQTNISAGNTTKK